MGSISLTDRELAVLQLIADGLSNREIALELNLTLGTVKWYARQIYNKLGVHSRTQAVAHAREAGLFDAERDVSAPSITRSKHNLPAQTTSFIGREQEIAEVKDLLKASRLLTLTGPPGTGKSRLALQAAEHVIEDFEHGVYLVDLASTRDPDLVADTIVRAYKSARFAAEPFGRSPATLESFQNILRDNTVLLVLDNFEHVLDAANVVADLLAALPQLKVMVTSREPLHIYGEQEYYVSPMNLPAQMLDVSSSELMGYEGIALFVQRAQAIQPDFALTDENITAVLEICARLDGLPLAIELAAARIKMLPPEQMLSRLTSRLDVLTSGSRDLPTRLQNLRATLDWSHDLLTDDEKLLFARLSVFQGGRTVASAEAVCGPGLTGDVLDGLEALLNKNLLWAEEGTEGELRFYMLETIHEYAAERLEVSGEGEYMRERHAQYFTTLAERTQVELRNTGPGSWYQLLRPENDNVRTALTWTLVDSAEDHFQSGTRLAAALRDFWYFEGRLAEGRKWVERALSHTAGLSSTLRADILNAASMLAYEQGDHHQGRIWGEQALAIYEELDDKTNLAWALVWLAGHSAGSPEGYKEGMRLCDQAITGFRQEDDRPGLAWALNMLGEIARLDADYERAYEVYTECMDVCRETGAKLREAMTRDNLAVVEVHRGNYERAEALIIEGFVQGSWSDSKYHTAYGLALLAGPVGAEGYPEQAARLLGASEALFESIEAEPMSSDRGEIENFVMAVRNQLEPSEFEAAWKSGLAMTPEQAVAYALSREWVASPRSI